MPMLKNYLLIMLRTFRREKTYVLINILGLSLALACCMILLLYVRSELEYDKHHEDHESIVRAVAEVTANGESIHGAMVSPALGPLVVKDYPQVGEYVRFHPIRGRQIALRVEEIKYVWDDIYFVDSNVFEFFTHKAVYGDLKNALADPSSIAVSESFARQYWGDENPVGETISTDSAQYRVSAVFEDLPDNSHLKYDALLSYEIVLAAYGKTNDTLTPANLFFAMDYVYFKVPEGFQFQELESILNRYYRDNAAEVGEKMDSYIDYRAQPLADVHFDPAWDYDLPTGNIFYVYGFSAVALFILLVACINYTNLAIARGTKRSKEVGMRKVIGANKSQIAAQFMGESLLYALIAFGFSLLLVELLENFTSLPSLLGKRTILDWQQDPLLPGWLGLFALGVGFVAGLYPAFYLASISSLAALTKVKRERSVRFSLREGLVLVQFLVSIAVVACTILMVLQMKYIADKPLGYDKENRIIVQLRGVEVLEQSAVIRNELLKNPNILGVAESSFTPGDELGWNVVTIESNQGRMEYGSLWNMRVSESFFDVMGLNIVNGRGFSRQQLTDVENAIIVSESFVRNMNWDNPIGKRINVTISQQDYYVIGVVNDFHFASLRQTIEPMAIRLFPPQDFSQVIDSDRSSISRPLIIKLSGTNVFEAIRHIESVIARFDPNHPFEFTFFESSLNTQYASENNLLVLTGIFSGVCIFIACMGLYGLSAFNTEQRSKEIGVRKVLGASTARIILMLAQSHLLLIGVAALLASVASYLAIDSWLRAFAYRTEIANWVFFVSAFAVAAVAFITIALQASKTAQANPVKALRFE